MYLAERIYTSKNRFSAVSLSVAVTIATAILYMPMAAAQDIPVPPGFKRHVNGDVIVDDATTAVPPPGFAISRNGKLVFAENETTGTPESDTTAAESATTDAVKESVSAESEAVKTENGAVIDAADGKGDPSAESVSAMEEIPPGFHRMPNGDIMANNPSKAVAPPGYRLTDNGILKRLDDDSPDNPVASAATIDDFNEIPPGFHRMPDGTLMANNPSKATAPDGYHLMPDGTLMKDGGSIDHSIHSHKTGGMLMAEYKFERMYMDGLLDTTHKVTPEEAVDTGGDYRYSMSPTDMTMDMHMIMLMYHSREYMVMLMLHYMENDMGMLSFDGTKSTMKNSGIADTILTYSAQWKNNIGYTVGLSIPTGSIDEHGPMQHTMSFNSDTKYPYGMQLGSGTWDLILGIDYEDSSGNLAYGLAWDYTLRTGTNDNDYTLGDKSVMEGWARWSFNNNTSTQASAIFREVGKISGEDPELDPGMSPAADASNYGGRRLDLGMKLKYENSQMTSVALELTLPVYQDLFGPQMKTEWIAGISVGYMF